MKIYLTTTGWPLSWAIRKLTHFDASHCGIGDISRRLVLHASLSGLHFSHLNRFMKKNRIIHVFEFLPANGGHSRPVKKCYYELLELLETPYDYLNLLGFGWSLLLGYFGIKSKNKLGTAGKMQCSEALFVFLETCIRNGIINDILQGYNREDFSPAHAFNIMSNHPEYFYMVS